MGIIEYNHPSIEKTIEFYDRHLIMVMSIRSDLLLYKQFVSNGMNVDAERMLDSAVEKFDELKVICNNMRDSIDELNKHEVTKTISYGKVIVMEPKQYKKAA